MSNANPINRLARAGLAAIIRRYLAEEITAFEFDEALLMYRADCTDKTVDWIAHALWFHYDDLKDHKVVLSHEEWDYFQRLLLILESNAHIDETRQRLWKPPQLLAVIGLLGFVFGALQIGWGEHLFALALPFGLISMLVACWWRVYEPKLSKHQTARYPFASVAELRRVRRSVAGFSKPRYPSALLTRQVRPAFKQRLLWAPWGLAWMLFSPIVLLIQALPRRAEATNVRLVR